MCAVSRVSNGGISNQIYFRPIVNIRMHSNFALFFFFHWGAEYLTQERENIYTDLTRTQESLYWYKIEFFMNL